MHRAAVAAEHVDGLPVHAREIVGQTVTVEEVLREIEKDHIFYDTPRWGYFFRRRAADAAGLSEGVA